MPVSAEPSLTPERDHQVPLPQIVKFLRQLSHDLRNHLNAAELQAAYLGELAEDSELKAEIKRLRGIISGISTSLQEVTSALVTNKPTLIEYPANDFVSDLRTKVAAEFPNDSAKLVWNTDVGDVTLLIDPQSVQLALTELFKNAFQHSCAEGPISVTVKTERNCFRFLIREPKQDFQLSTERWGLEPFHSLGQGRYGLGLYRSRSIIEAQGGQLTASYDSPAATLITTVNLPLTNPAMARPQ